MHAKQTLVVASILLSSVGELRAEDRTGTFSIGAGYRTDDSFEALATVERSGLFGDGSRVALEALVNARRQRLGLVAEDSSLFGTGLGLRFEVTHDERQLPGVTRQSTGASLQLSREVAPDTTLFVGYRLEDVHAQRPMNDLFYRLATLTVGLEHATADQRAGVALSTSNRELGSEVEMSRIDVWATQRAPVGPFIVHVGARSSVLVGSPPYAERLFFDGSNEIRGYAPGALGGSTGGWLSSSARAELELPLVKRWGISLVGWADAGLMRGSDFLAAGASVGLGLVWHSPIGPIRIDYAIPLAGPPGVVVGAGGYP